MKKILLLVLALALGDVAFGQRGSPPPGKVGDFNSNVQHTQKMNMGKKEVETYGRERQVPEKPFPWLGVLIALGVAGAAAPFAYLQFKSTRTELEALKTFGRGASGEKIEESSAEEQASAPAGGGISRRPRSMGPPSGRPGGSQSRDAIFNAVARSKQWVTADWVARAAGVSATIVADTLGSLAEEGRLQEARDSAGNPVYRAS